MMHQLSNKDKATCAIPVLRKLKKVLSTIASGALEDILPSEEMLADYLLLDTGAISGEEFLDRGFKRLGVKR